MASATRRIRGLLKSMPPTFALPTVDDSGKCSSVSSGMKHWSIQDNACMNRSRMSFSSVTMRGNLSTDRPQSNSLTLCAMASMRSTRSPLV